MKDATHFVHPSFKRNDMEKQAEIAAMRSVPFVTVEHGPRGEVKAAHSALHPTVARIRAARTRGLL